MKKKRVLIGIVVFVVIVVSTIGVIKSEVLITPTTKKMEKYTKVADYDILVDQAQKEQDILADYASGSYTLDNPYVIQDPYQANPLSALILFETASPATVRIQIDGKDQYTTFDYSFNTLATHHEIPVLGLYANKDNQVTLTVTAEGQPVQTKVVSIQTENLPFDFPNLDVQVSKPSLMEPGMTLMTPCFQTNYTYILDANGDVRAYFSNKYFGHGTTMTVLQNGRILATGDVMKMIPYNMYTLWEMNLLGKVFVEYEIPNAVHHDVMELENGDFLAASNNADMPWSYYTREDVIIRIDRTTGLVTDQYDLRQILDDSREPYNHFGTGIINQPNIDWAHLNSVEFDYSDDTIIASSPIQSAVVKFVPGTGEIRWILSSPEGWDGDYSRFQKYLLTPIGDGDFEWAWGQHSVKLLADSDNDPDTIELLMMDNGQNRSFYQETSIPPEDNYSRAVIYRINQKEMTIEQLWEYGKERGSDAYSTFLGSAYMLSQTSNVLIDFGGMLRNNGIPVDTIIDGVLGTQEVDSRVVEVQQDGTPVFDVFVTPNHSSSSETYQAKRISLYTSGVDYQLGTINGQRLGNTQSAELVDRSLPGFFINHIGLNFEQLYKKNGFLIAKGNFTFNSKTYMIGRLNLVLKNSEHEYIFQGPAGINGMFYFQVDLSKLEPGEYAMYMAGAVIEGMDAAGKQKAAYNPTGYKITVP